MDTNKSESDSSTEPDSDDERLIRETITLGTYEGHNVSFGVSREPENARAPDDFGANIFVVNADGKNITIARIDTAHSGCHIDRFYLLEGHPQRQHDYGLTLFSPEEALDWFLENERWRSFVERYDEEHGLPMTAKEALEKEK